MRDYLPWLLSAITIWMTVLAGNKHRSAWLVGIVNQALWLVWIIAAGAWGLLPMNAALWIVYFRNHWKWSRVVEQTPVSDDRALRQRITRLANELEHAAMTCDELNASEIATLRLRVAELRSLAAQQEQTK